MQALAKNNKETHPLFKDVGAAIVTAIAIGTITSTQLVPGMKSTDPLSTAFFAGVQNLAATALYHYRTGSEDRMDWNSFVTTHLFTVLLSGSVKIGFSSSPADYTPMTLVAIAVLGTTVAVVMLSMNKRMR